MHEPQPNPMRDQLTEDLAKHLWWSREPHEPGEENDTEARDKAWAEKTNGGAFNQIGVQSLRRQARDILDFIDGWQADHSEYRKWINARMIEDSGAGPNPEMTERLARILWWRRKADSPDELLDTAGRNYIWEQTIKRGGSGLAEIQTLRKLARAIVGIIEGPRWTFEDIPGRSRTFEDDQGQDADIQGQVEDTSDKPTDANRTTVTDGMVERAAYALLRHRTSGSDPDEFARRQWDDNPGNIRDVFMREARVMLEAALGGEA